jgi:hypothetical protein
MLVIAAVAGSLLGAGGLAPAQSHSGEAHGRGHSGGGSGGGGGNGAGILPDLDAQQAAGIRKTLSSEAQRRADTLLGQQQAAQDWLLQQQTQRKQRGTTAAENGTRGNTPPSGPPPAAMDIIKWPALLQERSFASERAKIEAPYRRSPSKLSAALAADYRQMASTVEDMKAMLEGRLKKGVDTADYNAAKGFLGQLGQEIAARLQTAGNAKEESGAKPPAESKGDRNPRQD